MKFKSFVLVSIITAFLIACATVPITGRRQLNLIPSSQMLGMSFQQYGQFLKEHKVITGTPQAKMVKRVGRRI